MSRADFRLLCHVTFIPRTSLAPLVKSRWHERGLGFKPRSISPSPLKSEELRLRCHSPAQRSKGDSEGKEQVKLITGLALKRGKSRFAKVLPLFMNQHRVVVQPGQWLLSWCPLPPPASMGSGPEALEKTFRGGLLCKEMIILAPNSFRR